MPYGLTLADWMAGPGTTYYWDPVGGNDGNAGTSIATARLTWDGVYALLTAGQGDHVVWVDPGGTGQATYSGDDGAGSEGLVDLTLASTALFGPGPGMAKINPAEGGPAVSLNEEDTLVSGVWIDSTGASTDAVNGGNDALGATLVNCWIEGVRDGVGVQHTDFNIINCTFITPGRYAIVNSSGDNRTIVRGCTFNDCTNDDAIWLQADDCEVDHCTFRNCTVGIDDDGDSNVIRDCVFVNCTTTVAADGATNHVQVGGVRTSNGIPLATVSGPLQGGR